MNNYTRIGDNECCIATCLKLPVLLVMHQRTKFGQHPKSTAELF